ncbi:hypothetical protein EGT07_10210 [Herbaspirillum sp. HC18]|nr:hypothetical protein EGT07_10210 [Herbaspirillum sp. HC18]
MEKKFKDLHAAALAMATQLLGNMPGDGTQEKLEAAVAGGAIITMEIGPLPDVTQVSLYLQEREGRRHRIVTQSIQKMPLN